MLSLSCSSGSFPAVTPLSKRIELLGLLAFSAVDLVFTDKAEPHTSSLLAERADLVEHVLRACDAADIGVSDVFLVPGRDFEEHALNHPDPRVRDSFEPLLDGALRLALATGSSGVTVLPGLAWPSESRMESITLAGRELARYASRAADMGLALSFEPHRWSVAPSPGDVEELLHAAPQVQLTLDYSHFICDGHPQETVDLLLERSRHIHVRSSRRGKLHTTLDQNEIDFERLARHLRKMHYSGYVALEHEPAAKERADVDPLDVLTETVRLRQHLEALGR